MKLSIENSTARRTILLILWIFAAAALYNHARVVRDYLDLVGQLGLRGNQPSTPFQQANFAFAADAQTWIRHAVSLLEGDSLRLRYTLIDNAPAGREVHWNSAWAWLIAASGKLEQWVTGHSTTRSVERAAIWLPPVVLFGLVIVLSRWTMNRFGAIAATFVTLAMIGHPRIYEGFFPSYVDHHGLLTAAVLGMILGVVGMGAGWYQSSPGSQGVTFFPDSIEKLRGAAVFAAISASFGMWVSAASILAPIAIVGCGGLVTVVVLGRRSQAVFVFDPRSWQLWGRVGASLSILFYLLEYFPNHLGLRLEANHPVYSLAWWGGSEFVARFGKYWTSREHFRPAIPGLVIPTAAILVAPALIFFGGTQVFVIRDPFLSRLHHEYIQEFLPLWRTLQGAGWKSLTEVAGIESLPLLIGVATLALRWRTSSPLLLFTTFVTFALTTMAWVQSRWLLNASGAQVALVLVLMVVFLGRRPIWMRWGATVILAALFFVPSAVIRTVGGDNDVKARRVSPKDANSALARDIAATLRHTRPEGEIVLLTSPNSSTAIGYYGRFQTLGTLYWENVEGLKSAAQILAAKTQEEAKQLIKAKGVTHLAFISEENFIEPYYRLLHPAAAEDEIKKCFGYQILAAKIIPTWLRMIPYQIPSDLNSLSATVMLFEVAFQQTPADALYHIALAKIELGELAQAEHDLETLIQQSPSSYQPYLRKGELLFQRKEWDSAASYTIEGIRRSPELGKSSMFANAASAFYREKAYAQAIKIYRTALEEEFDPTLAAYLAFVLATAKDPAVRNGAEAQTLAERALSTDKGSPTFLNALGAAYAENGEFDRAMEVTSQAVAKSKERSDSSAARVSELRLMAYQAGRPWRE